MLEGREITVLGAGIAGLALSLALAQRGARVELLEQADAVREFGAGLQISPNGANVLHALGLGQALNDTAPRARAVVLRDFRAGAEVFRLPLTREDRPYHLTHRADLIALLRHAASEAGVEISLGQRIARVETGSEPRLHFETGAVEPREIVLGADGLHSPTRAALNGEAKPFFTGQVAWRMLLPWDRPETPPEATVHMGPGRHLVSYPLRGGELLNIVAVEERKDWAEEGWHHRDDPANVQHAFADFAPEIRDLLHQADPVYLWGLFRHPVAARWHDSRVAILGDAAHPTLPFLAQGANLALEDAWVLADEMSRAPAPEAFASYQSRRQSRAARVVEAASGNARNYHLRPGPKRVLAHTALRTASRLAPGLAMRKFDWLYGFDVTSGR